MKYFYHQGHSVPGISDKQRMLTLAALRVTFSVTTMENSVGKRSQFTSSWEEGKLMEVWGLEKCIPLTSPACFMCTPGTSLEVSFSRTKDKRSRGSKSEDKKQVKMSGRLFYYFLCRNRYTINQFFLTLESEMINGLAKSKRWSATLIKFIFQTFLQVSKDYYHCFVALVLLLLLSTTTHKLIHTIWNQGHQ